MEEIFLLLFLGDMVFCNLNIFKKLIEKVIGLINEFSRVVVIKYRNIDIKINVFFMIMSKSLEYIMEIYCIYDSNKIYGN